MPVAALLRGLRLQIHLRVCEDQFARALGPGLPSLIQRSRLPTAGLEGCDGLRQLTYCRFVGARQRHQILHVRMRAQDPDTHLILDDLRQHLNQ